jgi:hypothetical protein
MLLDADLVRMIRSQRPAIAKTRRRQHASMPCLANQQQPRKGTKDINAHHLDLDDSRFPARKCRNARVLLASLLSLLCCRTHPSSAV